MRAATPLSVDPSASDRQTGSFILVDEGTNGTVAAGVIVRAS
jgi:sulfate adenylyltransferase subunit 1 (EFTu-like GTPase family)